MDILEEAESAARRLRARLDEQPDDSSGRPKPPIVETSESGFDLSPNFSLEFGGQTEAYAPMAAPDEFSSTPIEPGQERLAPGQGADE